MRRALGGLTIARIGCTPASSRGPPCGCSPSWPASPPKRAPPPRPPRDDAPAEDSAPGDDTGAPDDSGAPGDTADTGTAEPEVARWLFLVFMNGDNDLEDYVTHDLNELEQVGSGDGVHVVVQADRIRGYDDSDGDWTSTRRYYVVPDGDLDVVRSTVIDEPGELDMGDPAVLAEFVAWAEARYPAERVALVLWNHGDSWSFTGESPPPPSISSDDTSGNVISIAEGELAAALEERVATRGRFDVIGFDACLMGSWEVAHSLVPHADWMVGSEVYIGWEGYAYGPALALLRGEAEVDAATLARELARGSVEDLGEWSQTAVDLDAVPALSAAVDTLAGVALEDPAASATLAAARDGAGSAEGGTWHDYYLDLQDMLVGLEGDPVLGGPAADALDALGQSVTVYEAEPVAWQGGLSIYASYSGTYLASYRGAGATWSRDTRWDEWLETMTP